MAKIWKNGDLTRSVRCCGRKDGWDFCLLRSHPTKLSPQRHRNIDTRYEGQTKFFTCIKSTSLFQPSRSSSARSASSLKPFSVLKNWHHLAEQGLQAPLHRISGRLADVRLTSAMLDNLSGERLWQQRFAPAASLSILRPAPRKECFSIVSCNVIFPQGKNSDF